MVDYDEKDPITFEWARQASTAILTVSEYVEAFVDTLKDTVPPSCRSWDPLDKTWTISSDWIDEVTEIEMLEWHVLVDPVVHARGVLRVIEAFLGLDDALEEGASIAGLGRFAEANTIVSV